MLVLDSLAHSFHVSIACHGTALVDIAHVEHRLSRQQKEVAGSLLFFFLLKSNGARRASLLERLLVGKQHGIFGLGILVAAHLGHFFHTAQTVFNGVEVFDL